MPLAGGQGWAPTRNLEVQLTLLQPGGQIMPTTLLLAHPDLKSQRHLCKWLITCISCHSRKTLIRCLVFKLEVIWLNSIYNFNLVTLHAWKSLNCITLFRRRKDLFFQSLSRVITKYTQHEVCAKNDLFGPIFGLSFFLKFRNVRRFLKCVQGVKRASCVASHKGIKPKKIQW